MDLEEAEEEAGEHSEAGEVVVVEAGVEVRGAGGEAGVEVEDEGVMVVVGVACRGKCYLSTRGCFSTLLCVTCENPSFS